MSETDDKSDKIVNLRDPRSLLSGRDLLEHYLGNHDFHTRIRLVKPEEETDHEENISKIKDEFRAVLSQQRVVKADAVSEGEWDNDGKRVRIRKAVGKWNIYGYLDNKILYVDAYEALHLLEMNKLIVFWDTVIISLEQAYTLFLGFPGSLSLEEYKVYSTMMRAGFYLLQSDPNRKYQVEAESIENNMEDEQACVWRNLYRILRQPHPLVEEDHVEDEIQMQRVQQSMLTFNSMIALQSRSYDEGATSSEKYSDKHGSFYEPSNKKQRIDESLKRSDIGIKTKLERFSELFDSFDIIRNTIHVDNRNDEVSTILNLNFDVFSNSEGVTFRKSNPYVPDYRIIVRLASDSLLTASDIASLYNHQPKPKVPILLMQVSETLSVHCFMYGCYSLPKNLVIIPLAGCPKMRQIEEENDENSEFSSNESLEDID